MSKLLLITKINLLRSINNTKIYSSSKSERKRRSIKILGVSLIILYIMFYAYYYASSLMPSFIALGKPLYLIGFLFTVCCIYILFSNIFRIKDALFAFKDYDLLMSLPIDRNVVITSKIISLYVIDLLFTLIVMIPGYVAYIKYADLPNDGIFFISLFVIPLIPMLISSVIGIILTWFTSFFKNKTIGSYFVNLLLVFVALFIAFQSTNIDEMQMANYNVNIVDTFSKYYPFTTLFVDLLENVSVINLCIFYLLPILLTFLFVILINKGYLTLRNRLLKTSVNNDYKIKTYHQHSSLKRLYIKELKRYFSNALYVINTSFGCILILILIISTIIFGNYIIDQSKELINIGENNIASFYIILLSLLCCLSSTTNSSISLEGKSFWIIKMLPVGTDKIILSKIMVNLTIIIPTVIISGTFFGIYFHLPLIDFIFIYLMPLAYGLFAAVFGILLNLVFPKFDFENEIKVIKQSLPVFLSILIGIIMILVPFRFLEININSIMMITSIIFLIDIVIMIIIHYYGNKRIKEL